LYVIQRNEPMKRTSKKLQLIKETIRVLQAKELRNVAGGFFVSGACRGQTFTCLGY
jgi:hypothetical protein